MNLLFKIEPNIAIDIPGLSCTPNYITAEKERELLETIDRQPWMGDLKRRVQHYGYKYDYVSRAVSPENYLGPLPEWLDRLGQKIHADGLFPDVPDQVIVNEYLPGQGIAAHVDRTTCFTNAIASLSLASPCIMQFANPETGEKKDVFLEARSLAVFADEARYNWTHGIAARKSDKIDGFKIERRRRVSLTFRKVILEK
ncbi:MAG: alpha-ketoglutarate-dependent dioxygenase AlkB [Rhodospirillales bacterium]|nr:alpha-ketoglutarate-dependent dioxygenase AlkB [Alphaproteobacteria bacterium]MCB9981815.1 alpha-ketoglutarate-dependent dioxygenase AlkB [Rhodospirillales bacterium]